MKEGIVGESRHFWKHNKLFNQDHERCEVFLVYRGNGNYYLESVNISLGSPILAKNTTSGIMLGCYIICSERTINRMNGRGGLIG
jgi:hypothetical protein